MHKLKNLLLVLGFLLITSPAHAFLVTYTDFASWKLAVGNIYHEITDLPGQVGDTLSDTELVPLDHSGDLAFAPDLTVEEIGNGWATWSHGYTGEVARTTGSDSASGSFKGLGSKAFGMDIEPDDFGEHTVTVTLDNRDVITQDVEGNSGAGFFGWAGDEPVTGFDVESDGDFAVGDLVEAAAAVPEPLTVTLLGLGLSGLIFSRRRKSLDLKKSTKEGR